MRKLIILDIDGTLRDFVYGIPKSAIKAVNMCKERGHIVCICTGRSQGTIPEDVINMNIEAVISGGGCYIKYKNNIIKNEHIEKSIFKKFYELFNLKNNNIAFAVESNKKVFMNANACKIFMDMNKEKISALSDIEKEHFFKNEKIVYKDNIKDFNIEKENIHKICIWSNDDIKDKLDCFIKTHNINIAQTGIQNGLFYNELIKKGSNKGDAINILCNYLKIDLKDTIAFGDSYNDIDMFNVCKISIAMKGSPCELTNIATGVCESVMEDGIYNELLRRNII